MKYDIWYVSIPGWEIRYTSPFIFYKFRNLILQMANSQAGWSPNLWETPHGVGPLKYYFIRILALEFVWKKIYCVKPL